MKKSKKNYLTRTAVLGLALGALVFFACGGDEEKPSDSSYTVSVETTSNGTIDATPKSGKEGTVITVTVNPAEGYVLKAESLVYKIGANTTPIGGSSNPYTFNLPASNVTIKGEFEKVPQGTYTVTIAQLTHGTITANPQSGQQGTTITLTVTPEDGYFLKEDTLKYTYGSTNTPISGRTFVLPAQNVTVSAQFDEAENANTLISAGIDSLLDQKIDSAVGYFDAAYGAFPKDDKAIVYSSLAKLASIPVSTEFRSLVSNRLGITNYPATINGLISGDWLEDYYEMVEWYYDDKENWVSWYDGEGWKPNGYTVPGYYYWGSESYTLVSTTPKYEKGGSFLGFSVPDWFTNNNAYKDNIGIVGDKTVYTIALQPFLLFANLLDKNTNGLNELLDGVVTSVFGASLDEVEARINTLGTNTIDVDGRIIEALGMDELFESKTVYIGKAEISLILASMRVVKASLEFLQAYDWSTDLVFLKTASWNEDIIDDIPPTSLPLKSNFLKSRDNGATLATAKNDYSKAIDSMVAAYDTIIGDTRNYPPAAIDQIKEFEWIKDGLSKLKTAINDNGMFYVKEGSGSTYNNTATDALVSIDMGKLFTAGQLAITNLVVTEGGSSTIPQFYGYKNGDQGTAITAQDKIKDYEYIGFKLKLDNVKQVIGNVIPDNINELSSADLGGGFNIDIAEKIYVKYHQ
ncbi:MAG: hypothetical protein LBK25_05950 [Treponema sp.]|jgi:hypothetical protein|nr:hypothetical protein [Treponema sp.]